ncbi:radical SAM protein [Desulfosediminicola flagellatus]|uniref:radical SAM protein n=1 Tax=Desulfosediminicola flagellatus TaxID=2569541 RepID=UPI0010AD183E|nr:radical SAM protein [Desulfosediminicola flagellatus]
MDYVGQIIRPPSEANSIILQVTVGCSHNKCTFCGAYKEKRFSIKDDATVDADIQFASQYCRKQHKVFLADGDALILPFPRLIRIFKRIKQDMPWVRRVSLYGSARSIRSKTSEQLSVLKELGLDRVYLGLESGSDTILSKVNKGETAQSMIQAAQHIKQAGLFLSVTVLLGLAEVAGSENHAIETGKVLSKMMPNQIAALTLMVLENTELGKAYSRGEFQIPHAYEMLSELKVLVEHIDTSAQFHANHASNYLPIMGRLPRDKEKILALIHEAQSGARQLVPEGLRRL